METIRISVLECDPLTPSICLKYGSYGGVIESFLERGAKRLGWPSDRLVVSYLNVQREPPLVYPNLDEVDCIIITGSRPTALGDVHTTSAFLEILTSDLGISAYDNFPWITSLIEFTKKAYDRDGIRLIGLCFGHQIIGRAVGQGGTQGDEVSELSICKMDLTEVGVEVFGKKELAISQFHHDMVDSVPKGALALGSSPACNVQAMMMRKKFFGMQGHPEFDGWIMSELLKSGDELHVEDKALLEDGVRRSQDPQDGDLVASTFLRFLVREFDD